MFINKNLVWYGFYVDDGIMVLLGKYINIVNIDVDFYVIFYIVM